MARPRKGKKAKYKPQVYPGADKVSDRRRKATDPTKKLAKFRSIPDDNIVLLLGHRFKGESYVSVHPPLDELVEKYDPVKDIIEPTPGARAGDRIRYIQFADSIFYPPMAPWLRPRLYMSRLRGCDVMVYSGRQLLEQRERDIEGSAKWLMETEVYDPARDAIRGITVHGHSLRLDEDGLMFDARRRYKLNKDTGEVEYIKNMHAEVLDNPIPIGRPLTEREARGHDCTYRWDVAAYKSRTEILTVLARYSRGRITGGFNPELTEIIDCPR
jgi:methyl-coenzyme M reductase gamma subunit